MSDHRPKLPPHPNAGRIGTNCTIHTNTLSHVTVINRAPTVYFRTSLINRKASSPSCTAATLNSSRRKEMDVGHYNCRDYHVTPHTPPSTITATEPIPWRPSHWNNRHDESFDELEHRSRSPRSFKPKFPLLKLPLELRQQIFRYILPYTRESVQAPLRALSRNIGTGERPHSKCSPIKAMHTPSGPKAHPSLAINDVVWKRGCTSLMAVCRQLHDECADLIYGTNTFLIFITYNEITFGYKWLIPSGIQPRSRGPLLDRIAARYLTLIRRVVLHVDHVDSYTGMTKFNVGGSGLAHGLRRQVQILVNALRPPPDSADSDGSDTYLPLMKVNVRISNGNSITDALKSPAVRQREKTLLMTSKSPEEILYPLGQLHDINEINVQGVVPETFARELEERMSRPHEPSDSDPRWNVVSTEAEPAGLLCVYGNDI